MFVRKTCFVKSFAQLITTFGKDQNVIIVIIAQQNFTLQFSSNEDFVSRQFVKKLKHSIVIKDP